MTTPTREELPKLPSSLLKTIGEYGMARSDGLSPLEVQYRWEQLIDGIKDYAIAALLQAQGEPIEQTTCSITDLQAFADGEYCRYIDQLRRDECLGVEYKLANGKFGQRELDAHRKAAEHLGAHKSIHLFINSIKRPSQAQEPQQFDQLAVRALAKSFRENPREASLTEQAMLRQAAVASVSGAVDELPPLPEPAFTSYQTDSTMRKMELRIYSSRQMHEYAALSRAQATQPAQAPFPERDPAKPAEQQGMFRKFDVRRVDGSDQPGGKHYGCRYFVLDLDHDPAAPVGMQGYAAKVRATHPQLADDIEAKFGLQPAQQTPAASAANGYAELPEMLRLAASASSKFRVGYAAADAIEVLLSQSAAAPVQWDEAQRICDLPVVDEAIRNLLADQTGDNATCMVRAILEAAAPVSEQKEIPMNIIRSWPERMGSDITDVQNDLFSLQRRLAEYGFTMKIYEATPSNQSQGGDKK